MRRRKMKNISIKILAVLTALMLIAGAVLLVSCGKSGSGSGSGTESGEKPESQEEEKKIEYEKVSGNCYVLAGMSSEDEEFDEDLIKDMFGIKDLSEYMTIYFREDGKAKMVFLKYGKKALDGEWEQKDGEVNVKFKDIDGMQFTMGESGVLSTVNVEEDDDEFLLTLSKTEEIPDSVK